MIILVNKWDLIEKENNTAIKTEKEIRGKTAPFTDYPILFISATNKQRIHRILETVSKVNENRNRKISTSELNEVLLKIVNDNPPPAINGKYIKIKYVTQLPVYTPSFAFFCNFPQYIKEPYKRYIENRIREKYDFSGAPVRIFFRKK
jgi:GTP-binding protein